MVDCIQHYMMCVATRQVISLTGFGVLQGNFELDDACNEKSG